MHPPRPFPVLVSCAAALFLASVTASQAAGAPYLGREGKIYNAPLASLNNQELSTRYAMVASRLGESQQSGLQKILDLLIQRGDLNAAEMLISDRKMAPDGSHADFYTIPHRLRDLYLYNDAPVEKFLRHPPETQEGIRGYVWRCFSPSGDSRNALTFLNNSSGEAIAVASAIYALSYRPSCTRPPAPELHISRPSPEFLRLVGAIVTHSLESMADHDSDRDAFCQQRISFLYQPLPAIAWQFMGYYPHFIPEEGEQILARMMEVDPTTGAEVLTRTFPSQIQTLAAASPNGPPLSQLAPGDRDLAARTLFATCLAEDLPITALHWVPAIADPLLRQIAWEKVPDPILRNLSYLPQIAPDSRFHAVPPKSLNLPGMQSGKRARRGAPASGAEPAIALPAPDQLEDLDDETLLCLYPDVSENIGHDSSTIDRPMLVALLGQRGQSGDVQDLILSDRSPSLPLLRILYAHTLLSPERLVARLPAPGEERRAILNSYAWRSMCPGGHPGDAFTLYASSAMTPPDRHAILGAFTDALTYVSAYDQQIPFFWPDPILFPSPPEPSDDSHYTTRPRPAIPSQETRQRIDALAREEVRTAPPVQLANLAKTYSTSLPFLAWELLHQNESPEPNVCETALGNLLREDPEKGLALLAEATPAQVQALGQLPRSKPFHREMLHVAPKLTPEEIAYAKAFAAMPPPVLTTAPQKQQAFAAVILSRLAAEQDLPVLSVRYSGAIDDPILRAITQAQVPDPILRSIAIPYLPPFPERSRFYRGR